MNHLNNPPALFRSGLGLPATQQGTKVQRRVASTLDRIGKEDDAEDATVFAERNTFLCPNAGGP